MTFVDPYEGFSKVFDKVVSKNKYDKWEEWIKEIWSKNNVSPNSLLDIACGTGNNAIRFAGDNIEVWGIDNSTNMLNEARRKTSNVKFLKGHFLNFYLPKKVDAAVYLDFSTNYILKYEESIEFLKRVYDFLNVNGIFIFDFKPLKSFTKKEKHLCEKDFTYDWECNIENDPFVIIDISVSINENGKVEKFKERHIERGYTVDEIKKIIQATHFKLIEIYDNCILKEPNNDSELIQIALKKVGS